MRDHDSAALADCGSWATFAFGTSPPAHAQAADYPTRTITFIVGFAPGGGIDTFARVVAQELNEQPAFRS